MSNRCPEYSALYRRVAEPQKVAVRFRINPENRFPFFAASIGLRIETTDFYLITARKMAQLVGSDRSQTRAVPTEKSHVLAIRK